MVESARETQEKERPDDCSPSNKFSTSTSTKKKRNRKKKQPPRRRQDRLRALKKLHGSKELGTVTVDMCIGGMRGITVRVFFAIE